MALQLQDLLDQLSRSPLPENWRAIWLRTCETIWNLDPALDDTDIRLDQFISILQKDDMFSTARLVIPALRREHASGLNAVQQKIMTMTEGLRHESCTRRRTTQSDFDDAPYVAEKRILHDAEMHRARVLFHQHHAFGEMDEDSIRAWLDAWPGCVLDHHSKESFLSQCHRSTSA